VSVWELVFEAHSCMHMVLMSHHMNPRMVWCFGGETFMGVMRLLGEACNKSCLGQGVPSTNLLMRRYAIGIALAHERYQLVALEEGYSIKRNVQAAVYGALCAE
jgi:hypothetical protein